MNLDNVGTIIRFEQPSVLATPDFLKPGFLDPDKFFHKDPTPKEAFFGAGLPDIFLLFHIVCVLFVNLFFKKYFTSYKIVDINVGFSVVGLVLVLYLF